MTWIIWETKFGPYTGGYGKTKTHFLTELAAYKHLVENKEYNLHDENNSTDYEIVEYYPQKETINFIHNLADMLHDNLCHMNHADYCGYHYEKWDTFVDGKDKYSAKQNYYTRVVNLINLLPGLKLEGYLEIIQTITGRAK